MEESATIDAPRASREKIAELLDDPELLGAIERYVRGRIPRGEVDDVVQATVTDALASQNAPADALQFRKWIHGVARHKVADHFRRRGRDPIPDEDAGVDVAAAESAPHSARELLRWAESELPEGEQAKSTLEWMLREGAGEKLEHIAEEANLPAPRVRQRVSRMRRYFKSRWAAAATVVAVALLFVLFALDRGEGDDRPIIAQEDAAVPRHAELRKQAFEACEASEWRRCLVLFDDAKKLDPKGDDTSDVRAARDRATKAIESESNLELNDEVQQNNAPNEDAAPDEEQEKDVKPAPAPSPIQEKKAYPPPTKAKPSPTEPKQAPLPKAPVPKSKGSSNKKNSDPLDFLQQQQQQKKMKK